MNKYVEDCPCGNPYPHGVEFAGRYQFVCDKCGRKTKWFYERNNARYSWNRKIRYKRNKEKGVGMETDEQRLAKTKEYVTTLLNKERYMKWNARTVLLAIRECLQQGMDIIPPEDL